MQYSLNSIYIRIVLVIVLRENGRFNLEINLVLFVKGKIIFLYNQISKYLHEVKKCAYMNILRIIVLCIKLSLLSWMTIKINNLQWTQPAILNSRFRYQTASTQPRVFVIAFSYHKLWENIYLIFLSYRRHEFMFCVMCNI